MKKIFNLLFALFIILLSSCSTKYGWWYLEADVYYRAYDDEYILTYSINGSSEDSWLIVGIDYDKYNIDYVLIGDEVKIKADAIHGDVFMHIPQTGEFQTIKKVKIKRAERKEFEVTSYEKSGITTKQIECSNKEDVFLNSYINEEQVIFTNHRCPESHNQCNVYCHTHYDYTTLKDLEVGTKLVGTVYKTDDGYGVYAFYLKSYIDNITSK